MARGTRRQKTDKDDPVSRAVEFNNRLVRYDAYDAAHLLHPDHRHFGKDEVIAWMQDFKAVDDIYAQYADVLDGTLKVKAEMTREPFLKGIPKLIQRVQTGNVEGIGDIVEAIGFKNLISYVNDMRDIAAEQVRRWQEVLGDKAITRDGP